MSNPTARPPAGRVIMVQGTSSHAGKSTLVAALCRILARAGYRVAPFKAQNMSNNAAVTDDGGEIGRAQAVQAMAARVEPTVDMNPVLLKPQSDRTSQVVVLGRPWLTTDARDYYARKSELWPVVTGALDRLRAAYDVVVIEGAGSPAEINLAQYDIVNMRVARYADAPVLLVGDIDRGGVFAALYGTVMLLTAEERAHVRGFIINKFRGDPALLTPGFSMIEQRTGVPTLGVLPYLDLARLPAEDGLELDARGRFIGASESGSDDAVLDIVVLRLPRIANLDEFQALAAEPGVQLRFLRDASALGSPDLIIVPGTKSTVGDLAWLRERGLDQAVTRARHDANVPVLGICGGFQLLGEHISDPLGVEGAVGDVRGLGLLPMTTTFAAEKITERVSVQVVASPVFWQGDDNTGTNDASMNAYEIHMGRTERLPGALLGNAPFVTTSRSGHTAAEGATTVDGMVTGTYLHGLLEHAGFRRTLLMALAKRKGVALPPAVAADDESVEAAFDLLADAVQEHLDMDTIYALIGLTPTPPHDA